MTNSINTRAVNTALSRRAFVVGSAAVAGGGLALGFNAPFGMDAAAQGAGTEVNVWVVVKPDDTCVIRIARTEMGQGTRTGLAMLVAEELESCPASISRASARGARWERAAAAASAPHTTMCAVAARRHA